MDTGPIGMMNGAYFKGRHELLQWINELLSVNVKKVEECASGALHCQVFDALFPGKVPMRKVKYDAKYDYEFVANYKVLQDVFLNVGISKVIPVDRLIKGRYQDNLEFLQWVYEYYQRNSTGTDYDPLKRRQVARGGPKFDKDTGKGNKTTRRPIRDRKSEQSNTTTPLKPSASVSAPRDSNPLKSSDKQLQVLSAEWEAQDRMRVEQLTKMKAMLTEMEGERDYYYKKMETLDGWLQKVIASEKMTVDTDVPEHIKSHSKGKLFIADRILKLLYEEITPEELLQSEGHVPVQNSTREIPGSPSKSMSVDPVLETPPKNSAKGQSTLESIFDEIQKDELLKSRNI